MILTHLNHTPRIHPSACVAPNATICGDVIIGQGCRIMFGACIVAEGKPLELGENCIVMENAVIRSTDNHPTKIGNHCLIGPNAHVVGCTLEDCVFIATGASIFHGAKLGYNSEVRVNGVVHLRTNLPAHATVPIGWVAVGSPAQIFPPDQHEAIWAIQKPLNFPKFVYGVERAAEGESNMQEITKRRSEALDSHKGDTWMLLHGDKEMIWKDELPYLWNEYQYRHDLVWRVVLRLTFVVAFLSIIPYANDSLRMKIGPLVLALPGLSVVLAIFGSAVVANEYRLLMMIKEAYHQLQTDFFSTTFGKRKDGKVPSYPEGNQFRRFLIFYLVSLVGLAFANLMTLIVTWK